VGWVPVRQGARNLHDGAVGLSGHEALTNLQAELFHVRVTLNQFRAELVHHGDNYRAATDGDEIIARATHASDGLDGIISRVQRRLTQR
jgi:hypothetical protein